MDDIQRNQGLLAEIKKISLSLQVTVILPRYPMVQLFLCNIHIRLGQLWKLFVQEALFYRRRTGYTALMMEHGPQLQDMLQSLNVKV